jgi:hypothetical protein
MASFFHSVRIFVFFMDYECMIFISNECRSKAIMAKSLKAILIILVFICLAANASCQGYVGTVSTGTGIIPALTVGKSSISSSNVGSVSSQANLSGSWALDLKGTGISHLDMQMYQEGDLIFGTGRSSADNGGLAVTAAGFVVGDRPTIFITRIDGEQVFRLKLSVSGEALAGEYDSLSPMRSRESGTVTGRITFAARKSPATALGKSVNPSATTGAWVGKATQSIRT